MDEINSDQQCWQALIERLQELQDKIHRLGNRRETREAWNSLSEEVVRCQRAVANGLPYFGQRPLPFSFAQLSAPKSKRPCAGLLTPEERGPALSDENAVLAPWEAEQTVALLAKFTEEQVSHKGAFWLGQGKVEVDGNVIILTKMESEVLQALVEARAATKPQLLRRSGHENAVALLKRIRRKHEALAIHIILPGGKGLGGYRTTIQQR